MKIIFKRMKTLKLNLKNRRDQLVQIMNSGTFLKPSRVHIKTPKINKLIHKRRMVLINPKSRLKEIHL